MTDFSDWLASTAEKRAQLLEYSLSPLPTDSGERQLDVSTALERGQDAGDLLADAEKHLIDMTAFETLATRRDNPDLSAEEKKAVVKSRVSDIYRLRDGLKVLYQTIRDRRFALMNINRAGF